MLEVIKDIGAFAGLAAFFGVAVLALLSFTQGRDIRRLRDWAASRLVGTPDEVLGQLRGWEELGVEQVICSFSPLPFALFEDEQLELAGELVLPRL